MKMIISLVVAFIVMAISNNVFKENVSFVDLVTLVLVGKIYLSQKD